jgi:hypothetical protein
VRTVHLDYQSSSDTTRLAGPVSCPAGKRASNAGLLSLSADQAWIDGVASDPSGSVPYGSASVGTVTAANPGPGSPDYLRNPVPADSGPTADGTGWTLKLTDIRWPIWHQSAYGMDANIWLVCLSG